MVVTHFNIIGSNLTIQLVSVDLPKTRVDLFSNDPSSSSDGEILSDDDFKTNSDGCFSEAEIFDSPMRSDLDFGISRLQRAAAMEQKLLSFKQRSLPKRRYLMKPAAAIELVRHLKLKESGNMTFCVK